MAGEGRTGGQDGWLSAEQKVHAADPRLCFQEHRQSPAVALTGSTAPAWRLSTIHSGRTMGVGLRSFCKCFTLASGRLQQMMWVTAVAGSGCRRT